MKARYLPVFLLAMGLSLGSRSFAQEEIVVNDAIESDMKIDGKVEPIEDGVEKEEILGLLEGIDGFDIKRIDHILVKPEGSDKYEEVLYREALLKAKDDNDDKDKSISFKLSLTKIVDDYILNDLKETKILGEDVVFTGFKNDFYTSYRSDFKIDNGYFRLESHNVALKDFVRVNEIVIKNIKDLLKSEEGVAVPGDKSEGLIDRLEKSMKRAKTNVEAAKMLIEKYPDLVKGHLEELRALIEKSEGLLQRAQKIYEGLK